MAIYNALTEEEYKEMVDVLTAAAHENLLKEDLAEEGWHRYEVVLQNDTSIVTMSDDEVETSAKAAVDILEELKRINKSLSKQKLEETERQIKEKNPDIEGFSTLLIWNSFATKKLNEIVAKIAGVRRVGGAYAMLIAIPFLKSAIYSVFDRIIDDFDNEDIYVHSCYFVFRAIMQMNPS